MFCAQRIAHVVFTCALLFIPCSAQAATQPQPSPTPQSAFREIVQTVGHGHEPEPIIKSARPTYIITRSEMEARGAHTVAEALRFTPGVAVLPYGGFGAQAGLSIRGSSRGNEVLVLIDGFPISLGSTGSIDLGTVPIAGLERIEVTESGVSTLYGANAVAGVINLITGTTARPDYALQTGSLGDSSVRASASQQAGPDNVVGIAVERHIAGNDYAFPAAATFGSADGYGAGTRTNADAELSFGRLTDVTSIGRDLKMHILADTESLHLGVPNSEIFGADTTSRSNISHVDLGLSIERERERSQTTFSLFQSNHDLNYSDLASNVDASAPPNLFAEDTTDDRRTDISLRNLLHGRISRLLTGVDFSRQTAHIGLGLSDYGLSSSDLAGLGFPGLAANAPIGIGVSQSQSSEYAQYEHDLGSDGTVYFGLRNETDKPSGSVLAPAFGTRLPLGILELSLNTGESYLVPTLVDLYYPGFSNPNLLPSRARNYDATLQDPQILGGASLGIVTRQTNNYIALDANFKPQNIARASVASLIATAQTLPMHGVVLKASFTDNYRALDITDPSSPVLLASVPSSITILTLEKSARQGQVGFGLDANAYGPTSTTGAWSTIDSFLRLPLRRSGIVTLRVQNIGDERYELYNGYPLPGRTFSLEYASP